MNITVAYGILFEGATGEELVKLLAEEMSLSPAFVYINMDGDETVILGTTLKELDTKVTPIHAIPRKISVLQEAQYKATLDDCPAECIEYIRDHLPQIYIIVHD